MSLTDALERSILLFLRADTTFSLSDHISPPSADEFDSRVLTARVPGILLGEHVVKSVSKEVRNTLESVELQTIHVPSELYILRTNSDSPTNFSSKYMCKRQIQATNVRDVRDARMENQCWFLMLITPSVCVSEHAVPPPVLLGRTRMPFAWHLGDDTSLCLTETYLFAPIEEGFKLVQIEVVTLQYREPGLRQPQVPTHIEVVLHAVTPEYVVVAHGIDARHEVDFIVSHEELLVG